MTGLRSGGQNRVSTALVFALAGMLVALVVTGRYTDYVRPVMGYFLIVTAALLLVLGVWTLHPRRSSSAAVRGDHLPATAWLLLCPVLVVALAAPGSLGAFTAVRSSGAAPPPVSAAGFGPLPAGDPLGIPLDVYAQRAAYGGGPTLAGRTFSLLGFVSPGSGDGTWYLTRLRIRCCAADALPIKVLAVGADRQSSDQWLQVTGTYLPVGPDSIARLQVLSVEPTEKPAQPYVFG